MLDSNTNSTKIEGSFSRCGVSARQVSAVPGGPDPAEAGLRPGRRDPTKPNLEIGSGPDRKAPE